MQLSGGRERLGEGDEDQPIEINGTASDVEGWLGGGVVDGSGLFIQAWPSHGEGGSCIEDWSNERGVSGSGSCSEPWWNERGFGGGESCIEGWPSERGDGGGFCATIGLVGCGVDGDNRGLVGDWRDEGRP